MGPVGFGRRAWSGGAVVIFIGAILISAASTSGAAHGSALHGIAAAVGAGLMFGIDVHPVSKGLHHRHEPAHVPHLFHVWRDDDDDGGCAGLFTGGAGPFWHELVANRAILLWPMLGGFMWVVGDLFQNYAAKYVGISRGIPLSNTNQLWGLLLGLLVFRELHGLTANIYLQVIGGLRDDGAWARWRFPHARRRRTNMRVGSRQRGGKPTYTGSIRCMWRRAWKAGISAASEVRRSWVDWLLIAVRH